MNTEVLDKQGQILDHVKVSNLVMRARAKERVREREADTDRQTDRQTDRVR